MSKTTRRRSAKKSRRPARRTTRARQHTSDGPDLLVDVRRALADPNPLSLLTYVSTVLCVTDSRRNHPLAQSDSPDLMALTREELVGTFLDVPATETSALLAVIAEMAGGDDVLRARIRRELAARPKPEPAWLAQLSETSTYRAVRMSHVLSDGDNIMLGVRLPGGRELTCVVYIDHNLGTLVKDAFVVPESIATMVAEFRRVTEDPDTRWDDISLADTRAWVDAAVELAAITFPPLETETWPACRALVEWITRGLPAGGTGYQRPQWDSAALAGLADQFFASPDGARLDDSDHRGLLESVLWYGTDYGPGDPLRWSPVKVEILLDDWIPRKIVAPPDYLAKAPELLRAFVRFAHKEVELRSDLTSETLAAINAWEPRFQQTIHSPRPQGPAALLAALGLDTEDMADMPFGPEESENFEHSMLDWLALDVGGPIQLERLDDDPLPDKPFRWECIPDDVTARVHEVLVLIDRCCEEMLDFEYRTACRRVLARVASQGPEVFRRKGRAETAAAALVWTVGKANDLFEQRTGGMQVSDLMNHFGLGQSSVAQRAATILRAGGFDDDTYYLRLGAPDYLVAARRRRIITMRDRYRQLAEEMA
ncbi:DUF6398 domain-containing protein [Mycobacterium sp.]|uniref:DUF6398 domain-containing protein n=1 Tax=Mycobacterium sp. TaxID=1785 RepID=UPI003342AE83|nr:hypothetical protein [Mycobacterium sp.]